MESMRKGKSDITEYALEDMQEFFATVSEYFFMDSEMFRSKHPELNEFLEKMYRMKLS
jgi:Mlc titration factor MtfA (ptsG expression regulator)